ncbi:MAG: ankyrin repeat domain-containing protein [Micavibrio sp.]|nr:ankyrin repeat domain-containing protein [Micavibrio sp.]
MTTFGPYDPTNEEVLDLLEKAGAGDMAGVKHIIDAHPEAVNWSYFNNKNTPLIIAAERGPVEMVHYLLDKGANIDQPQWNNGTPLSFASFEGKSENVAALLKRGAKIPASGPPENIKRNEREIHSLFTKAAQARRDNELNAVAAGVASGTTRGVRPLKPPSFKKKPAGFSA